MQSGLTLIEYWFQLPDTWPGSKFGWQNLTVNSMKSHGLLRILKYVPIFEDCYFTDWSVKCSTSQISIWSFSNLPLVRILLLFTFVKLWFKKRKIYAFQNSLTWNFQTKSCYWFRDSLSSLQCVQNLMAILSSVSEMLRGKL